jgi:hypothetical protein
MGEGWGAQTLKPTGAKTFWRACCPHDSAEIRARRIFTVCTTLGCMCSCLRYRRPQWPAIFPLYKTRNITDHCHTAKRWLQLHPTPPHPTPPHPTPRCRASVRCVMSGFCSLCDVGGPSGNPLWVGVKGLGRQQAQQNIEASKGKV